MDKKLAILEYQNSFADNFSTLAYGKIVEKKFYFDCVYENTTQKRVNFEDKMNNFNLPYLYMSKSHIDKVSAKSKYMDYRDIKHKSLNKNQIINFDSFRIEDIKYLTKDILSMFDFNNLSFLKNYDILEEITSSNSIGLYINTEDDIDLKYINDALIRLNKYVSKPVLYVFTAKELDCEFCIPYQKLSLDDWREEFYFLKSCKHKIIYCTKNSYSVGFWASVLSQKNYYYNIYSKKLKQHCEYANWIEV